MKGGFLTSYVNADNYVCERRLREVEYACHLHPLVLSSTEGMGKSGNSVLLTAGLNAEREEGGSLQQDHGDAWLHC